METGNKTYKINGSTEIQDNLFFQPPSNDYFCSVCNCLLMDPFFLTCGHHLCKNCLDKNVSKVCQIDKEKIENFMLNKFLQKKIHETKIRCIAYSESCTWEGQIKELMNHYNNCENKLALCDQSCLEKVKKKNLEHHKKNECQNRIISCDHCNAGVVFKTLVQHFDKDCKKILITCPNECLATNNKITEFAREDLQSHLLNCVNENTKCVICGKKIKRSELEKHITDNMYSHFSIINDVIKKLGTTIIKKCNQIETPESDTKLQKELNSLKLSQEEMKKEIEILKKENTELKEKEKKNESVIKNMETKMAKLLTISNDQIKPAIIELKGHSKNISSIVKLDQDLVASASNDSTIKIWNLTNQTCEKTFTCPMNNNPEVLQVINSTLFASGHSEGDIGIYNYRTRNLVKTMKKAHENSVSGIIRFNDNNFASFASGEAAIIVWNTKDFELNKLLVVSEKEYPFISVDGIIKLSEREIVAHYWNYGILKVWDVSMGACTKTILKIYSSPKLKIDEKLIVCANHNGEINLWDVNKAVCVATLQGHTNYVSSILKNGSNIVSASLDGTIRIWNYQEGKLIKTLNRFGSALTSLIKLNENDLVTCDGSNVNSETFKPYNLYLMKNYEFLE
jgi:WD40 repeat protein